MTICLYFLDTGNLSFILCLSIYNRQKQFKEIETVQLYTEDV